MLYYQDYGWRGLKYVKHFVFITNMKTRESIKCMKHSCCSEGIIKYVSTYGSNYKDTKQIPQPTQTQQVP